MKFDSFVQGVGVADKLAFRDIHFPGMGFHLHFFSGLEFPGMFRNLHFALEPLVVRLSVLDRKSVV